MIPIRLELKNFMSYGEDSPALDFTGLHTVCLSGENGHGKSALLDAITWSLWGESRAGKNKHDDLVRIGADEMSVQFTFAIDGQTYRVLRKRSRRASGNQWELHQDAGGEVWRSLTGNVAGETEKAIQKLLRMSYDTFLNSAYLRQGQADQFVRQTPGKRKEILADILDLSRYDQLEAKARERMREASAEATDLERDINSIDEQLSAEQEHQDALAELGSRLLELQKSRETLLAEWDTLRARQGELKAQKDLADALQTQRAALTAEIADMDAQAAAESGECTALNALISQADVITADYEAYVGVRKELDALEESVARWHKGQKLLAAAELDWQRAENEVRASADRAAREYEAAAERFKFHPQLAADHALLAARVAAAQKMDAERLETVQNRVTIEKRFGELREESAVLDAEIVGWQSRLDALANQDGVCLVCNAPLPDDKVLAVTKEYKGRIADLFSRRKALRVEAGSVKDQIADLQSRETFLETQLKAARADEIRLGQVEQQLLALEEVQKDLPNLDALRAETARIVQEKDFARDIQELLAKYHAHLAKLEGVEAQHAEARARLLALKDAERKHLELSHARQSLKDANARLARTEAALKQRRDSLAVVEKQQAALPDVSAELFFIESRTGEIRAEEKTRALEEQRVQQEIGRHNAALQTLETRKTERAEKEKHLAHAKREQEVHDRLTQAFGKKGVQALIIENAIPELQEEANRLLERLTDGDMSLYFETLREGKAKSTGPIETLDIKVSDSLGTRPLEMYSGGEGFRAAFAIRIALSKLLARRAGAKLQTLIIDEGFGTQDGKGREKLVDALAAIGSEFERIIVITHIDELKDAFAARVEVTKTPSGSKITLLEGAAG